VSGNDPNWSIIVAVAGSILALLGVLVAGVFAAVTQRRHWSFAEQADACAAFLGEYSKVYICYARAVGDGTGAQATSTTAFVEWTAFNHAMEVLHLMAAKEIVDAAHDLDHALWAVGLKITRAEVTKDNWGAGRAPLDTARLRFVNIVRASLGNGKEPLERLTGRPEDDDPIWHTSP